MRMLASLVHKGRYVFSRVYNQSISFVAVVIIFFRTRWGEPAHNVHIVFDFTDGIYADFFLPIYQALKKESGCPPIKIAYSSKISSKQFYGFDANDFIPNMAVRFYEPCILICASVPSFSTRSEYVRKIQIFHGLGSMGSLYGSGFIDGFEKIFVPTRHLRQQLEDPEYDALISQEKLVNVGYPKIDGVILPKVTPGSEQIKTMFYGPTYHKEISSIFHFLPRILEFVRDNNITLYVKIHPLLFYKHNKDFSGGIDWSSEFQKFHNDNPNIILLENNMSFKEIRSFFYQTDVFLTDVSGLGFEYCLITGKPVIFLGDKLKIPLTDLRSGNVKKYIEKPEIKYRGVIGPIIERPIEFESEMRKYISNPVRFFENIELFRENFVFNLGSASDIAVREILSLWSMMKESE